MTIQKGDRTIKITTEIDVESDATDFDIAVHRKITENGVGSEGEKIYRRKIPRDFQ